MNLIHEFALLIAIAVPFLAIVALNVYLFCCVAAEMPGEIAAIISDYRISSLPAAANDADERKAA